MINYKEILRLHELELPINEIGRSCGCDKSTVSRTIKRMSEMGLTWEGIKDMTSDAVAALIHPKSTTCIKYEMPDFQHIKKELARPGVTLQLLWIEYCDECQASHLHPYKYTQFRKYYQEHNQKAGITMHLEHKRGDIMQVDWCGTTLSVRNKFTGKDEKAYVFVATLPYSGYSYVEAFLSMKEEEWLTAHIHAYGFFGGVSRILVPDNLKTGVIKNTKDETTINPAYYELAEYYGTAVIPARPRSPKDKAAVEGTVGKITTAILAPLRDRQYFSLSELNEDIHILLKAFNEKSFQKMDGSRLTRFEEERPYLHPLPPTPYEIAIWKPATVQFNYHVTIDGKNYSCPYEYVKKTVKVRVSQRTVEVFYDGKRIASHMRLLEEMGNYSTVFEHMPPDHQYYQRWNGEKFRKWAKSIGQSTADVVECFLTSHRVEEQGYKSCISLLALSKEFPKNQLEQACCNSLMNSRIPSLHLIRMMLKAIAEQAKSTPDESYGILRGAEYYSMKGDNE